MAGEVERRIVSVLFADIVGFTSLSESLDPEDVAAVQDVYFAAVRSTIGRYAGRLEKFIGDAAMAVFGIPRGREDDAERAVRAGLALLAAIDRMGIDVGLEPGALRLRVGVNTGEVAYQPDGADEGRVTGDTVNLAARLQTAAPPGGLLVGEGTCLAVAAVAELGDVQELELKGKSGFVRARLVTSLRPAPSREHAMGRLRAPMLGRDQELHALLDAVENAGKGCAARTLVLAPPGAGKSRLLEELSRVVAPDVAVLRARARPDSVHPYAPVRELLTAASGTTDPEVVGPAVVRALVDGGGAEARAEVVAAEVLAVLRPDAVGAEGSDRDARFAAWLDALDALLPGRTQLWLVEDVHWAGGDLRAFLAAAGTGAARRLVVATARPHLLEDAPAWCSTDGATPTDRLALAPLRRSGAAELITALVGHALPLGLRDALVDRADGNPLFIEEVLRSWIGNGALVLDGERWVLDRQQDEVALPTTVRAVYAAQLDDLDDGARSVVRRASVAGRRFPLAALPALDVPSGAAAIDGLLRRTLISGPQPDVATGEQFSYRHALLRDAGYESLSRGERARLHVQLAEWLEEVATGWPEVAELVAQHYAAAAGQSTGLQRPGAEGLTRDELRRRAAAWFERAAVAAEAAGATDAAALTLRRSLEIDPAAAVLDMARRRRRLGQVLAHSADATGARSELTSALEALRADGSPELREETAIVAAALCDVDYEQLRFVQGAELARSVLDQLGEGDDAATARLLLAEALLRHGADADHDRAAAAIERVRDMLPRLDDPELALDVMQGAALVRAESGDPDPVIWRRVGDVARQMRRPRDAVMALLNEASGITVAAPGEVSRLLDEVEQTAQAHGLGESLAWAGVQRVELALLTGDWDDAVLRGAATIDAAAAAGFERVVIRTWIALSPVLRARHDATSLAPLADFLASAEPPRSPYGSVVVAAMRLRLADLGLAEPFVPEPTPQRCGAVGSDIGSPSWAAAVERVVQSWLEAGLHDEVSAGLVGVRAAHARFPQPPFALGVERLLAAELAAALGEDASVAAQQALELLDVAPWWQSRALRLLGQQARAEAIDQRLGILV